MTLKYSEPDEERHELRLMVMEKISSKQASDWLLAFHKVTCYAEVCILVFLVISFKTVQST